ncbi:hypothetical protein L873DRAFT_250068 [Choiromyces venosus 120613-1]|uniref:Uncharacterized protein n=1 Tax=Choiromyces venosus 120613-1 TaxID=1336337 RepID=A0A3N4J4G2_9PEZI|nr:hypothetical protein L873DRAFT_250068 [Choiromyces venosus 120613-1]
MHRFAYSCVSAILTPMANVLYTIRYILYRVAPPSLYSTVQCSLRLKKTFAHGISRISLPQPLLFHEPLVRQILMEYHKSLFFKPP